VDPRQLQWLDRTLSELSVGQMAILVMHHPIVLFNPVILDSDKKDLRHFITENHDEVRQVVEKYRDRVRVVLSGHTHTPEYRAWGGIHYISTPSINTWPNRFGRFTLQGGTLSWEHVEVSSPAIVDEAWKNLSTDSPFLKALGSPEAVRDYFTHGPMRGSVSL
jgi:hypothetical protein